MSAKKFAEIEAVEEISRVEGSAKVDALPATEEIERVAPNKEHFDSLMTEQAKAAPAGPVTAPELPEMRPERVQLLSEIREVDGRIDLLQRRSPQEIMDQTKDVIADVDKIKNKLQTPGLQLDDGSQVLLQNKLSHIDDKLRIAIEKVGGEYTPAEVAEAKTSLRSPIERFLGQLENSETQLHHVYGQIASLGADSQNFSPATLLSLQLKVGYVQQELELFTSILNKSLESIKTLMNVQV